MTRTTSFTSVLLLAALVGGCSNAADGAAGGPGSDDPSAQLPPYVDPGSDDSDGDDDGLSKDVDLCPGTPKGEAVDGNGCSESQKKGSAKEDPSTWSDEDNGDVDNNGFATFILDPKGAVPVVIKTLAKNVQKLDGGFALSGTLSVQIPGDQQLTFAEAKVELKYDSAKGEGLQSFQGSVRLPFPAGGFMQGVEVDDLAMASVGYDLGANIQNVDAPIKADRKYFFFNFSAGLSASIGEASLSIGPGVAATMTLDPSDPSFYLKGAFGGLLGPVEEASVGFSYGGHLPFTPAKTWGIDAQAASFDGHLWLGGKVNLVKIPISVGGNTVIDLDPNDDGKSFFQDPAGGYGWGSNSDVSVSLGYGIVGLEIPIGGATVVGKVTAQKSEAWFSGEVTAGTAFGDLLPVSNSAVLKAAGYLSQNLPESYFKAEGTLSLDATKLGQWTGIDVGQMGMAQATLNVDKNGALIQGVASASFSPLIALSGNANAEAFFNGNPNDWYVKMDGNLSVKGIGLSADAHAQLSKNGAYVSGKMQTPISQIAMSGNITQAGVDLQGSAQVTIPIVAGKEIAQWVTDAAVCGTELVTDAALCGVETVTNAAKCGTTAVTSAAQCGTQTVTSAAQCGTQYVTSGAQCGYQTVTSGAQCGWNYVSCGASCVVSLFQDCQCKEAKTCQVAKSCSVPKTCTVAATCNIPNTCTTAKSCEKVKTCETKVTVPDFNYGSVQANVTVKIGNSGLYGDVSGSYCTTGGSCTQLVGGHVDTSSGKPEACITVPGLGEFCQGF